LAKGNIMSKTRQEIRELAKALNIDGIVRAVAKAGQCDDARINYTAEWEEMIVRATFGAGTNTARVTLADGRTLYRAHDYGRHLEEFHYGPWCERMSAAAEAISLGNSAQEQLNKEQALREESSRFTEVDI
jgi:hypothetical protein